MAENKKEATAVKKEATAPTPVKAQKPEEGTIVAMAKKDTNGGATKNYMWVEGTGKSKHLPKGKKFEVQNNHGEHLIAKGSAKKTEAPKPAQPKVKVQTDEDDD